jgi:hypothetical protein
MKTKLSIPSLLLLSVILIGAKSLSAQQTLQVSNAERFIAYSLYNFSKLIDWPNSSSATVFQIAVVGDRRVFTELENLASNKKVGNASYNIIYCKTTDDLNGNNQIVYLDNMNSNKVQELAGKSKGGVLYVTERRGMTTKGSTISFMTNDKGAMGFEIAKENAVKSKLSIRAQLERLATRVI